MSGETAATEPVEVAIVGGGIVGLVLAAGLVRRNVRVKVFEQARNFRELGVGIAFTAGTVRCMEKIDPIVVKSLRSGGAVNLSQDQTDKNAYLRWLDGYTQHRADDPAYQKPLCTLDAGPNGWEAVRRDHFCEDLFKSLPEDTVQFRKRLDDIEQKGPEDKIKLTFLDGTTAEADAVFGCDGIKSRTRQVILGPDNPASYPQYTHKIAYRTLIPIVKVKEIMGEYKTMRQHFHVGPNAHIIHYPVNTTMISVSIFVTDPNEWPQDKPMTARGKREDISDAVNGWCPPVRELISLFPEEFDYWALFDLFEYPVPAYNHGRVCLLGDAAHAASPHHGAGASMGVEDALSLCTLMEEVDKAVGEQVFKKNEALRVAFETFNEIRRGRSQWLVNSSRRVCDLYQQPEWSSPAKRIKAETCFEEIRDRSFKIWHFDHVAMIEDTVRDYKRRQEGPTQQATNGHVNGV